MQSTNTQTIPATSRPSASKGAGFDPLPLAERHKRQRCEASASGRWGAEMRRGEGLAMRTAKNLAPLILLLPLAVLGVGLLALVRPQQARRIARDAIAEYRKRAR